MKHVLCLALFAVLAGCSGGGGASVPPSGTAGSSVPSVPSTAVSSAPSTAPASPASGGATSAPSAAPTSQATQTSTPRPTSTPMPTATPDATLTPAAVNDAYDPPAGTFELFPASIFLQPLSHPSPNPSSGAWISKISPIGIGAFQFPADASANAKSYMFPVYQNNNGPAYKIHCVEPWGTCALEGRAIRLLPSMVPESGTATGCNGDCHLAFVNGNDEYDLWATRWPPSGSMLNVGWGGVCPVSGPGYSACASTATGTALTQGVVRVSDLLAAALGGGTLPYALQVAVKCSDYRVAPFTSSDGKCSGGVPEGERGYLAMHDADINATTLTPIAKALLRTIDEDHYGVIVTDKNGGQSGFSLQSESDTTYTALGLPGPWVTQFVPEAQREGLGVADSSHFYTVGIPFDGIDFGSKMKFL